MKTRRILNHLAFHRFRHSGGVFKDMERLYMTTARRVLKPSILRMSSTGNLTSHSLVYSSPLWILGTTFMDQLKESRLAPDMKERIASRCMDFLKELVKQYQLRLPASMEMLRKLELYRRLFPKLGLIQNWSC